MAGKIEEFGMEPIRRLLLTLSSSKSGELDKLLDELSPVCELDKDEDRILFQARPGNPNAIRIGLKGSVRLQVHAYASGIILLVLGTPEFFSTPTEAFASQLRLADQLFQWAVTQDLREWVKQRRGIEVGIDQIFPGTVKELDKELVSSLTKNQGICGEGLFQVSSAFILLHELAHLKYKHKQCEGAVSIQQENEADCFAADWLVQAASSFTGKADTDRLIFMFGIAIALLWLSVFNIFLGDSHSSTHPQSYNRLFQVLDRLINSDDDNEGRLVWLFVTTLLHMHMCAAGFNFDESEKEMENAPGPRNVAIHLIDRISRQDRRTG